MTSLIVVLAIVLVLVLALVVMYNGLVQKRVRTQEAWSQIDVQLKRRYDLIPNLVETVKGYAAHERGTLEAVTQARNQAMAAQSAHNIKDQVQAENVLTGALRQMFALSEAYPTLKANENFAQLQEELAGTENKIASARQYYNDSSAIYNTACQTFPGNVIAGMFHFEPRDYFQVELAAEKEAPKVKF